MPGLFRKKLRACTRRIFKTTYVLKTRAHGAVDNQKAVNNCTFHLKRVSAHHMHVISAIKKNLCV